ncbi:MAG: phenylacetic acid degradation operon negative regulatory protein [Actinomycetota bacterium]|jgi:phenylacetic acid degradation operon negative regulatory protein
MSQVSNTPLLRPLTARSVIASTLLGVDPPRLPSGALVASGEKFGVAPGTTRVALSRMVEAGELSADDAGYALAGPLLERHARQAQGRHPETTRWNGAWRMAIVTTPARAAADRAALRDAMTRLRMAEMREGVWTRPDNLPLDDSTARRVANGQCSWFTAAPDEVPDASSLFGLDAWAAAAHELLGALAATRQRLRDRDADALGDTFVIAAATTRHLTLDPLLPPSLLPRDWPATKLRRAYDAYQRDFAATWRRWYRSTR